MVKGILKRHSLSTESVASACSTSSGGTDEAPKQKRVSFDGSEPTRVFEADEWDRSPAAVTLRLTSRDVIELRELDVCLVRTGHLMMERTPSRRPTRQRPPATFSQPTESPSETSSVRGTSITNPRFDEPAVHPTAWNRPRLSPTYQYQPLKSQSLPPLIEDGLPSDPPPWRGRGHIASSSDSCLTFHPEFRSHSPPGLPPQVPHSRGLSSPTLVPPSPWMLSESGGSPSPKPRQLHLVQGGSPQRIFGVPKILSFPTLSRHSSIPEELALETAKGAFVPTSHTLKPFGLDGMDANLRPTSLGVGDAPQARRKSLIGWELRKTGNSSGRRGFGLVRKGGTNS